MTQVRRLDSLKGHKRLAFRVNDLHFLIDIMCVGTPRGLTLVDNCINELADQPGRGVPAIEARLINLVTLDAGSSPPSRAAA